MRDSDQELLDLLLPQLSDVQVEQVRRDEKTIRVTAQARPDDARPCPSCGTLTHRMHGRYRRHLADVAVGGQQVIIDLTVRRLVCENIDCRVHTFAEQVPGLTVRYGRRTTLLSTIVTSVALTLAGRAGSRLLAVLAVAASRTALTNLITGLPDPEIVTPRVIGVDDFALKRGRSYGTVVIDAITARVVDVLADRRATTLTTWLRDHPDVEVVCRDGSAGYAGAIREALPEAVQVSDRWHLFHNLADAAYREVAAHSVCWAKAGPPAKDGDRAQTTAERWRAVHDLLDKGTGLLETARRLQLSLNTVKRYARAAEPERMKRAPRYRSCLVDPYRDHLRRRRATEPGVPVLRLFAEIKALGYTGSLNLLYRYITQGRVEADRSAISAKNLTRLLLTHPDRLPGDQSALLAEVTATCGEMTALANAVRSFTALLTPAPGNDALLQEWITMVQVEDLPHLHSFIRGLTLDLDAVCAGITLPYSNGPAEGVVNKIKMIKRLMFGRAGFLLLRKMILHR
ncbi:ISL3 family transposase [Spongiactinospora rosea]|uniref:ISL3 family transposase n=3 Tax=Spongiactinospora rosea TaxID=2248750 RepID=A0A366LCI5_9ACTN|nr:ISL3 family transposase [Spongiactinospora rosea]RBQ11598.1 ISL3 family transposase [Spongiactinospora rosea]